MADLHALGTIIRLASEVEEKISRPSNQLMDEAVPETENGGVLSQLSKLNEVCVSFTTQVPLCPGLTAVGNKSRVLLDVAGVLMVLRVGKTPRMERHKEERVHEESHDMVESLVPGESTVSTLVCQDPDASEDEALDCGICCPGSEAEVDVGELGDVCQSEVCEGCHIAEVSHDVGHGAKLGWLEAMGWDSVVNLLHGELRKFELIAVEIEMLTIGLDGPGFDVGHGEGLEEIWGGLWLEWYNFDGVTLVFTRSGEATRRRRRYTPVGS